MKKTLRTIVLSRESVEQSLLSNDVPSSRQYPQLQRNASGILVDPHWSVIQTIVNRVIEANKQKDWNKVQHLRRVPNLMANPLGAIRYACQAKQDDVAAVIEVSASSYSVYEKTGRGLHAGEREKLANFFGMGDSELVLIVSYIRELDSIRNRRRIQE